MKKTVSIILALAIIIVSIPLAAANSAVRYSLAEIGGAAYKICNMLEGDGLEKEIEVGGEMLPTEQAFQLITDALVLVDSGKSGDVVLNSKIRKPIDSNGNDLNIYAQYSEYTGIAKAVSQFMEKYDRVPNYGSSKYGKISYETMISAFARALKAYFDDGALPTVLRLKFVAPLEQKQQKEADVETRVVERIALMDAAERIITIVRVNKALPTYMTVNGNRFTMPELYYAFAKLVSDFAAKKVSDVEILEAEPPENNGEDMKNGSISRADYITAAKTVIKSVQRDILVPSYCETSLGCMGMETAIYMFAGIIEHFRHRYYLPETFEVSNWETLTGIKLPLPVETATPTPRPTPTPYDGVGAMEGDDFETGAVGVYGAVSSASKFASEIGLNILKEGGNAIDAAVATIFAVGLCEPSGSSVGGGGLSVIYLADEGKYIVFDYMSQTPSSLAGGGGRANKAMVPGIVHGAVSMLEKYGTMTLEEVLAPTIALARNGFEVTATMAYKMSIVPTQYTYAMNLYRNNGRLYNAGDIYTNPDLADTLQLIADEGIKGFYDSDFTDKLCDYMVENGSSLSRKDFANYTSLERTPLTLDYRGYTVYAGSGTAQGGSRVVSMLSKMQEYDLASLGHDSAETVRITATAFGVRPASYKASQMEELDIENLEDCEWYDMKSTTMLVTYDRYGNMVASNNTLGENFGCAVAVPGTGFCFNSGLNTSTGEPSSRIQSTMAPVIVAGSENQPILGVGSPGNSAIITATAITISNVLDFGMNVSQAINAPRFYGSGTTLTIENRYSKATLDGLREMGYNLNSMEAYSSGVGCVSAIYVDDDGVIYAGADYRREYMAYAY